MKRLFCAVLALFTVAALLFSFVGCGGNSDKDDDTDDSTSREFPDFFDFEDVSVEKTILVDEAGVKITARDIATRGSRGVRLMLIIENNTDKTLSFRAHSTAVNGIMVDSQMHTEVDAGKRVYSHVEFPVGEFERSEMHDVADIELCFDVFDTESWEVHFASERIFVRTSLADESDYNYDYTGTLVYEDEELTIIAQGLTEVEDEFAAGFILCVDNRTERNVTVQAYDVRLNGNPVTAIFNAEVIPERTVAAVMRFLESEFEKYKIEQYGKEETDTEEEAETEKRDPIMSIEFTLHIFDSDTWEKIADSERITLWFEVEG